MLNPNEKKENERRVFPRSAIHGTFTMVLDIGEHVYESHVKNISRSGVKIQINHYTADLSHDGHTVHIQKRNPLTEEEKQDSSTLRIGDRVLLYFRFKQTLARTEAVVTRLKVHPNANGPAIFECSLMFIPSNTQTNNFGSLLEKCGLESNMDVYHEKKRVEFLKKIGMI